MQYIKQKIKDQNFINKILERFFSFFGGFHVFAWIQRTLYGFKGSIKLEQDLTPITLFVLRHILLIK